MSVLEQWQIDFRLHTHVCASCKQQFFADNEVEQICSDCSEHGWVLTGSYEDPDNSLFNTNEVLFNSNDLPF